MARTSILIMLLALALLAGCAADHLRGGLYDAFRVRNDLQSSPAERLGQPDSPNYAEYERQRQERNH